MHDPETYENPDEFRPERFIRDGRLDNSVRDPFDYVFGFGRRYATFTMFPSRNAQPLRRICPGRHFADASLFLNIASVLHVFDIGPPVNEAGNPIETEVKMSDDGFAAYELALPICLQTAP